MVGISYLQVSKYCACLSSCPDRVWTAIWRLQLLLRLKSALSYALRLNLADTLNMQHESHTFFLEALQCPYQSLRLRQRFHHGLPGEQRGQAFLLAEVSGLRRVVNSGEVILLVLMTFAASPPNPPCLLGKPLAAVSHAWSGFLGHLYNGYRVFDRSSARCSSICRIVYFTRVLEKFCLDSPRPWYPSSRNRTFQDLL